MNKEDYMGFILQTVMSYPTKTKHHILKLFIDNKIAVKDDSINGQINIDGTECINVSMLDLDTAIKCCFEQSEEAVKVFEKWEFIKDYKYSVLFTCDDFETTVNGLNKLSGCDTIENDLLFTSFKDPIFYKDDERYYLKYNLAYSALHPKTGEELLLKYPFLVVFHKETQIVEFRYDVLKRMFILDQERDSYVYLIDTMIDILSKKYSCRLTGMDLNYMISVAKDNNDSKLIAQYMKLNTGQYAQLEVGHNQEYLLPFIGELKTIILAHNDELDKVPLFKETLEQFMYEKEEMSDYPWIEVLWENEIKTRSIHVKFIFNYMNKEYGLIQHYYSNVLVGMERMNYVVDYIASHRANFTETTK